MLHICKIIIKENKMSCSCLSDTSQQKDNKYIHSSVELDGTSKLEKFYKENKILSISAVLGLVGWIAYETIDKERRGRWI